MKTKTEILIDFYREIDEEIYILKNDFDLDNKDLIYKIEQLGQSKNLDLLISNLAELKDHSISAFVTVDELGQEDNKDLNLEIAILRIETLARIVQELLDFLEVEQSDPFYQHLQKNYQGFDLDFLVLVSLMKVGKQYLNHFLTYTVNLDYFNEAIDFFEYINPQLKSLEKENDFFDYFEQLVDLFQTFDSFLERISDLEMDINEEEQLKIEQVLYTVALIQGFIYFLLLIKQKYIKKVESAQHLNLQKNSDIVDDREEFLNEIKLGNEIK